MAVQLVCMLGAKGQRSVQKQVRTTETISMKLHHLVTYFSAQFITSKPLHKTQVLSTGRLPRWCSGKESACQCKRCRRHRFNPWVEKIPWRRKSHSSILAWLIPWTEKPGRLLYMGSQKNQTRQWLNTHTHTFSTGKLTVITGNK